MAKQEIFMQYFCQNCDCIFLDKDVKGRITPIKGFYCPECQALGFKNPEERPKKKFTKAQVENMQKHQFKKRKNSSKTEVDYNTRIKGDKK